MPYGADNVVERREPVAQACRILETVAVGEIAQPRAKARQRELRLVELIGAQCTRGESCPRAALERPERGRLGGADNTVAAAPQVDVTIRARAACIRRRAQLADQAQLLERGLELGTADAPLDPLQRAERGLDCRTLTLAAEIGAQPRTEIARAADVEHVVVGVAKEVDARYGRRAERERTLGVDLAHARGGEIDEVGDGERTALLSEADQL